MKKNFFESFYGYLQFPIVEYIQKNKNSQGDIWIYRLLWLKSIEDLDEEKLGEHWTIDPSLFYDYSFRDMIEFPDFLVKDTDYVLIGLMNVDNINYQNCLINDIMYPEMEVALKNHNVELDFFKELYVVNLKNMDKNNPEKSKGIKKIK